jgi:O-antigen/teichoic acid export membrane protein
VAGFLGKLQGSRRGVVTILSGTAVGQGMALVAAPLLSRLFDPRDFGIFAIISALAVTAGTVAALRFELAIPLPEAEQHAQSLTAIALGTSLLTGAIGAAAIAIFGDHIASAFNQPDLMPWLWFAPITATVMGGYLTLNQLAIRHQRYGAVGRRNLLQSVTLVLAQLGLGGAGVRPGGLVIGFGLGQFAGFLSLFPGASLRGATARAGRSRANLRAVARRYRRFPLYLGPAGLLNALGLQLPLLLIAYWYGSEIAGWLGMTQRVLALPVTLIGTAVSQVYLSELARAVRSDGARTRALFRKASLALAATGTVVAAVLLVLGPWLFALVFGNEWATSGHYARALALGLGAQFVAAPLSQTMIAMERQRLQLGWDIARVLSTFVVVGLAVHLELSALTAVWAVGTLSATMYAISWTMSLRAIREGRRVPA